MSLNNNIISQIKPFIKRHFSTLIALFFMAVYMLSAAAFMLLITCDNGNSLDTAAELSPPGTSAEVAIVIDAETLEPLYEKNSHKKAYPASITKILTALVTLEVLDHYHSSPDQLIAVNAAAVGVEGSSIYLTPEEKISITDLLYGLMLRSGNDAAVALAETIGGTTEHFVEMMNEKAEKLGCKDSNFINPNGLFDEKHYTTAYDMALISAEAMKYPLFREISATKEYTAATRAADKYCYFYNKNKVVHQYKGGDGIKIGYTKASGRTLVASATRDGHRLICVVMNAPDWFNDAYSLMDYCFETL